MRDIRIKAIRRVRSLISASYQWYCAHILTLGEFALELQAAHCQSRKVHSMDQ